MGQTVTAGDRRIEEAGERIIAGAVRVRVENAR